MLLPNTELKAKLSALDASQALIEFYLDGKVVTANANFLAALGYRLKEIRGQHHSMFVDPAEREGEAYRAFWAALRRGEHQVAVTVGDALFGLSIARVHDVFKPASVTAVPLAPPEVVGLINLRGRVVTALCLRRRLGLPPSDEQGHGMAVGLEQGGETFGLVVDAVGEVLRPAEDTYEAVPVNLDPRWRGLASGVHRLNGRLLVVLDVDALLAFGEPAPMAA